MINGTSPQNLPIGRGISFPSATAHRAAVQPQVQNARDGAVGIPPRQTQPPSDRISYEQAVKTHYNVKFKSGFAINGQAGRPIEKQISGNLAGLADVILKGSGPKQMACKLLVGLANQQKNPALAKNAQVVLEAVRGEAGKAGRSDITGHLLKAHQLNITSNLHLLQQPETRMVNHPAPSPHTADPTKPAAAATTRIAASNHQDLATQLKTLGQKLLEHKKAAESSAKNIVKGREIKSWGFVGGLIAAGLSALAVPVSLIALAGFFPAWRIYRQGQKHEQVHEQAYRNSIQECKELEAQIKSISLELSNS